MDTSSVYEANYEVWIPTSTMAKNLFQDGGIFLEKEMNAVISKYFSKVKFFDIKSVLTVDHSNFRGFWQIFKVTSPNKFSGHFAFLELQNVNFEGCKLVVRTCHRLVSQEGKGGTLFYILTSALHVIFTKRKVASRSTSLLVARLG